MPEQTLEEWITEKPEATLFTLAEAQAAFPEKSTAAVKMALSRLCKQELAPARRAVRGIYCRVEEDYQIERGLPQDAGDTLVWLLAGPGAGYTEFCIMNRLSWTTQVPMRTVIAMVGNLPSINLEGVVYRSRSNSQRLPLNALEASLLEAVRCFDEWAEVSWQEALDTYACYKSRGAIGGTVRKNLCWQAALHEPQRYFNKNMFKELLDIAAN